VRPPLTLGRLPPARAPSTRSSSPPTATENETTMTTTRRRLPLTLRGWHAVARAATALEVATARLRRTGSR
jgi:hypothetical protein